MSEATTINILQLRNEIFQKKKKKDESNTSVENILFKFCY